VNSDSDLELTPEQLYRLVAFLVRKGHVRAAADVMAVEFPRHHQALMELLTVHAVAARRAA
jgi:hypothetical protein